MKKLDVLMLKSFIGPFLLTTAVANFILLLQYMLKYFDDFVGKNLGFSVFAELIFYFSLNMLQVALPLGVLLASLMTFGNLGEQFELTAIKSSGISLLRTLRPIFLFVLCLSVGAFFFNNYTIPAANLKAYSLLYDIKHTKPALDIKAGSFYNGIPNYSIKAKDKLPDGKTLLDVIIYDHSAGRGNKTVILADSSLMYTFMDDRYLKLEMYRGHYYSEEPVSSNEIDRFYRTEYDRMDMVFSLASFDMTRRKEELFQNNRQMKNISELTVAVDSFKSQLAKQKASLIQSTQRYFDYHMSNKELIDSKSRIEKDSLQIDENDSLELEPVQAGIFPLYLLNQKPLIKKDSSKVQKRLNSQDSVELSIKASRLDSLKKRKIKPIRDRDNNEGILGYSTIDSLKWESLNEKIGENLKNQKPIVSDALKKARNIKVNLSSSKKRLFQLKKDADLYTIEKQEKYAQALACILMFLIGAPLGAIIKKGGLGVPTIIAIFFFIIYYAFTSIGEKQAKSGVMDPYTASWMSDVILLPFGLYFLKQARVDARLFEVDAYRIRLEKLMRRFARKKNKA